MDTITKTLTVDEFLELVRNRKPTVSDTATKIDIFMARAEALEVAANILTSPWTRDELKREQGSWVAAQLHSQACEWRKKAEAEKP